MGTSGELKFDFNSAANAEIRIAFDSSDGAWSYVGTDCRGIPVNQPTMNLGFLDGGTTAHEFGHAIGLAHEHQNPRGGIQWNEQVVIQELAKSPNFWDEETARHNVIRKYSIDQINGTDFDPDSIMLYFFPASWTLNGIATKANEVLSTIDKQFIAGAQMYPKTGDTTTTAVELEVNAKRRTAASIGKFGEEDLFRFTAATDGRHQIDTRGPTDVVMKLFGPNSETALIAEDDDSGVDTNALISAGSRCRSVLRSSAPLQSRQWQGQLFNQGPAALSNRLVSARPSLAASTGKLQKQPRGSAASQPVRL